MSKRLWSIDWNLDPARLKLSLKAWSCSLACYTTPSWDPTCELLQQLVLSALNERSKSFAHGPLHLTESDQGEHMVSKGY